MFFRFTLLVAMAAATLSGQSMLTGRVTGDDQIPIGGAVVTVHSAGISAETYQTTSDPTGAFQLSLPGPGDYLVSATHQGFYELKDHAVRADPDADVALTLTPIREVFQSVDVSGQPSAIDPAETSREETLTGTEINDIPYPNSHSLTNSLKLLPGVVQDPTGALHFNGAAENQLAYLLNGFNVGDPLTGRFNTILAVEGIRSLDFLSGRFSPEYGKGSAGILAIHTDSGADQLHYTATNFIPGVATQNGVHLSQWSPRFGISGPIEKGHAWFADNFGLIFTPTFVTGLPAGQNEETSWTASNVAHAQWNIAPSNILFADFLVNATTIDRAGLGALNPVSTTTTQRAHEYFSSIKDQVYLGGGILVEFGFGHNQVYSRQIPQGDAPYVFSPTGESGNDFVNSTQTAARDQMLANAFLPALHFLGEHRFKIGTDLDRLSYSANFQRTSYEYVDAAGQLLSQTVFLGSGVFSRPNTEASSYFLDTWTVRHNLHLDLGVREDWDELVRQVVLSPRASFAWSPFASNNTRISGGYAITYDPSNLMLFSQPLDQQSATTYYSGGVPTGPPVVTSYVINGPLKFPRSQNWSASVDHQFAHRISASVNYLRRYTGDGFAYAQLPDGVFQLTNLRNDQYHSESVIVKQSLAEGFEWMVSYTRSSAVSNSVFNFSVDQPMQVLNNFGPLPWDTPNRLLATAYVPLPLLHARWSKNWAIAAMADWRTGFPFSVVNASGMVVGTVDSHRFPDNFDLNLHVERRFVLRNYRFAIRGGFNNITNQQNPTAVNNVIGSPQYLQFLAPEGRHFVLRIRFFGRANP